MTSEDLPSEGQAATGLSITVFCGSRPGYDQSALQCARQTGELLGRRGHRLIYGAGGVGVMGAVANAAYAHGARIIGIIPSFLRELERGDAAPGPVVVTKDMFERKQRMFALADAFLALPGGYGTLDEVIEVISLNYLGVTPRPLVLLAADGFWNPLLDCLQWVQGLGFARDCGEHLFEVADDPQSAFDLLEKLADGHATNQAIADYDPLSDPAGYPPLPDPARHLPLPGRAER